jgi:hypothetical protein
MADPARRDPADPAIQRPPVRDARRLIYGVLDLVFAGVYGVLFAFVAPTRFPLASIQLWSLPVLAIAMGVGTLIGGRIGWRVATVASGLLLLDAVWLLVRILVSAGYLAGVYGSFGKAAATVALVAAALVVELVALLPLLQLKYLMTRAGRRAVGRVGA